MGKTLITDFRQDPLRNLIINGNMDFWQRGTTPIATNPTAFTYRADRFFVYRDAWGGATIERSTSVPNNSAAASFQVTVTSSASPTAGQQLSFQHTLEGNVFRNLRNRKGVLGFWVFSSIAGQYTVSFRNTIPDRSLVKTYTVNQANTWEFKTIEYEWDSSGTWSYDNSMGLRITWGLGIGTTFQTSTLDSWQAGNFTSTSGSVNLMGTNGAIFRIAQVQMNAGSELSPFSLFGEDYTGEHQACLRYYQRNFDNILAGNFFNGTNAFVSAPLHVPMRAAPTVGVIPGASLTNSFDQYGYGLRTPTTFAPGSFPYSFRAQVDGMAGNDLRLVYLVTDIIQADAEL